MPTGKELHPSSFLAGSPPYREMPRASIRAGEIMRKMCDERLIGGVAAGNDRALRELFDRHSPWIAARLRRDMSPGAVEDVLQETFTAVWRGAGSYRSGGAPGAWIWGIARRQSALWFRNNGRPEPSSQTGESKDPASDVASRADLDRALADLGPKGDVEGDEQRELARLFFLEDRSVADVASLLGVPEGTVKSRVYRLRHRLRASLMRGE